MAKQTAANNKFLANVKKAMNGKIYSAVLFRLNTYGQAAAEEYLGGYYREEVREKRIAELRGEPVAAPVVSMLKDFDDAQSEAPATSGAASLLKDFDASEPLNSAAYDRLALATGVDSETELDALRTEVATLKQQLTAARAALEAVAAIKYIHPEETDFAKVFNGGLFTVKACAAGGLLILMDVPAK